MTLPQLKWASLRLAFYSYIIFSLFSVVGGFLTSPLITYFVFGDWRFWKFMRPTFRLYRHGLRMGLLILQGKNNGFMFSVPLTSSPFSAPVKTLVDLTATWEHGSSCGTCTKCCDKIECPVLDRKTGLCLGYDSFFWRYFNCGRFPSMQSEIDYFGCPKWEMKPLSLYPQGLRPDVPYPIPSGDEAWGAK